MANIQGDAGEGLARIYDVEGGRYRLKKLMPGDVQLVHEMGHEIGAERLIVETVEITSGAMSQNSGANIPIANANVPLTPWRILACHFESVTLVGANIEADFDFLTLALHAPDNNTSDTLVWAWSAAVGSPAAVYNYDGSSLTTVSIAVTPTYTAQLPLLCPPATTGSNAAWPYPSRLYANFNTTGFGAGTAEAKAVVLIEHYGNVYTDPSVTDRGLPVVPR